MVIQDATKSVTPVITLFRQQQRLLALQLVEFGKLEEIAPVLLKMLYIFLYVKIEGNRELGQMIVGSLGFQTTKAISKRKLHHAR